ncbi:LysR family transcriptional regulator [Tardiphaga sp.]|uniref:LysR family transcriptional regulator n=1 Tax=Tardiphaga sp. TaxID=1926292 RepID=UPI00352B8CBC
MPATLDLTLLRSFIAVADLKSVSKAAQRLHRVQSAVSQQIQKLELQVGAPLFGRTRRGFELTALGETLYPMAIKLLDLNDETVGRLMVKGSRKKLTIGTSDVYAHHHLARILKGYNGIFGHVGTELVCDYSPAIWRRLAEGTIDIAITQARPDSVPGEMLYVEPLVWVSAQHSSVHQMRPLPLALFGDGCLDRAAAIRSLLGAKIDHEVVCASSHLAGVIAPVKAGVAVSILPLSVVDPWIRIISPAQGLPPLGKIQISVSSKPGASSADITGFCEVARAYFAGDTVNIHSLAHAGMDTGLQFRRLGVELPAS